MVTNDNGLVLIPGNYGKDCLGNGFNFDIDGKRIEKYCDNCEYFLCCCCEQNCFTCADEKCTRVGNEYFN